VGHAQHGHPLGGEFDHGVEHFLDHFRVQGAGGLVKEHHVGLHGQGPDDGDPLFLTPRQLGGIGVGFIFQADAA